MLVGNKSDTTDRVVQTSEGQRLADSFGIQFFETSAKADVNISKIFQVMGTLCIENKGNGVDDIKTKEIKVNTTLIEKKKSGCC